jgi:hypothetical protein
VKITANNATVTAACPVGKVAHGGGGSSATDTITQSYPVTGAVSGGPGSGTQATTGATNANGWQTVFQAATVTNSAYVLCSP